jgi:hypothetical protein
MKTKTFLLISVFAVLGLVLSACAAVPAASAQSSTDKPNTRILTASGNGKVYLIPDLAYVFIGVQSKSENVSEALNQNNAKAQAVSNSLKELGVDVKDIQTSAFNVYPLQEYGPDNKLLRTTFVVDNTVNITVRNLSILGKLLDTVVRNGANNINGIQFDVNNKESAVSQARKLAIESARKQAEEMAAAAGVQLGPLQTLSVYSNGGAVPVFEGKGGAVRADAAASVPVSSGQLVITLDATLVYEIK